MNTSQDWRTGLHELRALEQPELEFSAQTAAFDFQEKKPGFVLQKFGAVQETKELYVEYFVSDSFFALGDGAAESNEDALAAVGEEIREYLLCEDSVVQYAEENDLEILTITFYSTILEDFYLTFNSEICLT